MSWTIFFSADKIIAVKIFQIVELVRFSAPAEPGNSLQSDIRSKSPLKLKKKIKNSHLGIFVAQRVTG